MHDTSIIFSLFLIFVGAAIASTVALAVRQALIIGYIFLGVLIGPAGVGWISNTKLISDISEIGIIFLLFLLGLNLAPRKLLNLFQQTALVTLISSTIFALIGGLIGLAFGFSHQDSTIIGLACMFSSTIIGLKLLPTTVLHHKHIGEIMISILLLQDLIAITVILFLQSLDQQSSVLSAALWMLVKLPVLVLVGFLINRYILMKLLERFDKIQEYLFLLVLAWCLGMAEFANTLGFSYEVGAFTAGVIVATSPIALFIAESLKPLRDFFLVLFFFALGASVKLELLSDVWMGALVLGMAMLVIKPIVFRFALRQTAETNKLAWETGWRLGQMSEFTLLLIMLALSVGKLSLEAGAFLQLATIITFIGSSYAVVLRFPTPVAVNERLRRD